MGPRRRREVAGQTPSQVVAAQRRKQTELVGALVLNGCQPPPASKGRPVPVVVEEPDEEEEEEKRTTRHKRRLWKPERFS